MEESEVKLDIADMIMEHLVTETAVMLTKLEHSATHAIK